MSDDRGEPYRTHTRGARWVTWTAVLLYALILAVTIPQYGITWDAPENFEMGQRSLLFLTTGDSDLLDVTRDVRDRRLSHRPLFTSPWSRAAPEAIWPVSNLLSAGSFLLLHERLRLADAVDAHHLFLVPLAAIALVVTSRLASLRLGAPGAMLALAILALLPRFFGHAHNNVKDVPLLVFFTLTLLAGLHWIRSGRRAWWILFAIAFGLALGTRPNALFALLTLTAFVIWRRPSEGEVGRGRALLGIAGASLAGLVVVVAAWPLLWVTPDGGLARDDLSHPLEYGIAAVRYVVEIGRNATTGWNLYAPKMLMLTTPLPVLLFAAVGFAIALMRALRRRGDSDLEILLVAWTVATLGRTVTPASITYDGIRHVLEVLPALAVLAAIGAVATAEFVRGRVASLERVALPAAAALVLVPAIVAVARTHPFETTYFNSLAGGLGGAQARSLPYASDYWASSYRDAARWLTENAETGATVNLPVAGHLAPWLPLRDDLLVPESETAGRLVIDSRSVALYVVILPRRTSTRTTTPSAVPFHRLHPQLLEAFREVRSVTRQGGLIYAIHRADRATLERLAMRWPGVVSILPIEERR